MISFSTEKTVSYVMAYRRARAKQNQTRKEKKKKKRERGRGPKLRSKAPASV